MYQSNSRLLLSVSLCLIFCASTSGQESLEEPSPPDVSSQALVSKTHDLSSAIATHVGSSKRNESRAKSQAIAILFCVPREQTPLEKKEVSPGVFEVLAPEWFHEHLVGMAKWMEEGEKQISIQARIVTVSEEALRKLHSQFNSAWEIVNSSEVLVNEKPYTVVGAEPNGLFESQTAVAQLSNSIGPVFSGRQVPTARANELATAATNIKQVLPCLVATIPDSQMKTLVSGMQSDTRTNLLQAPSVTIFSGQEAVVKDTTKRPFVTSVKPVSDKSGDRLQPVITVLEDGLSLKVTATAVGDNEVQMDSNVTFSEIGDVDEFTFDSPSQLNGTTVQIPKYIERKVEVSKRIRSGRSLIIDPHFVTKTLTKRLFRSDVITREYTILILTPRVVRTETEEDADVVPQVAKL